jgi:hypothetical protein
MRKINIVTFAEGTEDYAIFMQKTLECFALWNRPLSFTALYIDNINIRNGWSVYQVRVDPKTPNSMKHGLALNEYMHSNEIKDNDDITIIVDADIAILYKNWDTVIEQELQDNYFFGFEPPPNMHRGNQSFPCIFFLAFLNRTVFDINTTIDFTPSLIGDSEKCSIFTVTEVDQAAAYSRRIGDTIKCDTGWKLPYIAHKESLQPNSVARYVPFSKRMMPYISDKHHSICKEKPEHMSEWSYNNTLFGTHKQACRNHRLDTHEMGIIWRDRVKCFAKTIGVKL